MEKDIENLVADVSEYLLNRLNNWDTKKNAHKNVAKILKEKFSKPKTTIPEHCGIMSAIDQETFASFQLLYYSIMLSHRVSIAVIDLGMTPKQVQWCQKQEIFNINWEQIAPKLICNTDQAWKSWNKPVYLQNSPYQQTLWLDPQCVIFDKLDYVFDKIKEQIFIVENPNNQSPIIALHLALQTNLVPHHAGPPNVHGGVIGFKKDRDSVILDRWIEVIKKCLADQDVLSTITYQEDTCLQWSIEMENRLDSLITDITWNTPTTVPSGTIIEILTTLQPVCSIAHLSTLSCTDEVPFNFQLDEFPNILPPPNLAKKCTIYVIPYDPIENRAYLQPIALEEFAKELGDNRIYLSPMIHNARTEYVGIMPGNLNERYKRLHFTFQNFSDVEPQLHPDRILAVEVAPLNWAEISESRCPGIGAILMEIAEQENIQLESGPTIAGNAFICHHTVFERFLKFWHRVYDFLLNKYDHKFGGIKPPFVYQQIPMIFFANEQLEIVPILDRCIKNADEDLKYHVCRYDGTIEAKFLEMIQAEGYCEYNRYRFARCTP